MFFQLQIVNFENLQEQQNNIYVKNSESTTWIADFVLDFAWMAVN